VKFQTCTVLAFSLLEACELSDTDEKFVLSAIDFKTGKEKKDIFEQVKSSLRKFQCREKVAVDAREKDDKKIETLVSTVKQVRLAQGWKQPGNKFYQFEAGKDNNPALNIGGNIRVGKKKKEKKIETDLEKMGIGI